MTATPSLKPYDAEIPPVSLGKPVIFDYTTGEETVGEEQIAVVPPRTKFTPDEAKAYQEKLETEEAADDLRQVLARLVQLGVLNEADLDEFLTNFEEEETEGKVLGIRIDELPTPDPLDGQTLIGDPAGDRWLEIGGIAMVIGMSGIGKSVLILQLFILWALGRAAFGIKPAKPLKVVLVQVENSAAKLRKMFDEICDGLRLTTDERATVGENIITHRESEEFGFSLINNVLEPLCAAHSPDIVALDPLTQLYGDNMNDSHLAAAWMTRGLQRMALKHKVGVLISHHTNKPQKEITQTTAVGGRYDGAGAAAFTNVPRANLVLRDIGSRTTFKLCAEKAGAEIGWRNDEGGNRYHQHVSHSQHGICWLERTDEEAEAAKDETAPRKKSKQEQYNEIALEILQLNSPLANGEWTAAILDRGVTQSGAERAIAALRKSKKVSVRNRKYSPRLANDDGSHLQPSTSNKSEGEG